MTRPSPTTTNFFSGKRQPNLQGIIHPQTTSPMTLRSKQSMAAPLDSEATTDAVTKSNSASVTPKKKAKQNITKTPTSRKERSNS